METLVFSVALLAGLNWRVGHIDLEDVAKKGGAGMPRSSKRMHLRHPVSRTNMFSQYINFRKIDINQYCTALSFH